MPSISSLVYLCLLSFLLPGAVPLGSGEDTVAPDKAGGRAQPPCLPDAPAHSPPIALGGLENNPEHIPSPCLPAAITG